MLRSMSREKTSLVEFGNLLVKLEGTTGAMPGDLTIYTINDQSVFLTPNAKIIGYLGGASYSSSSTALTSRIRVPQFRRPSAVCRETGGMYSVASQMLSPLGSRTAQE